MDGHFVPNISMGSVIVQSLRPVTRLPLEIHLMITDPDLYLDEFAEAGSDSLLVHWEGNNNFASHCPAREGARYARRRGHQSGNARIGAGRNIGETWTRCWS